MNTDNLNISKDLVFPIEAVTQKLAFIGRTGSGKSYGAMDLAEEFLERGIQMVALDPVGIWHGLRTSADGKSKGYSIPIFGGEYEDIPILPNSGALIANIIIDKGISAIIDVNFMRKGERKQFVTDFAEQLFIRKKKNKTAIHLFLEEAQSFAPQRVMKGEERMLGAMEDIVKLGRNYGIGCSIITQRPQSVHKDCLNQTEALFAFQINGAHERKAIEEWIVDKGLEKKTVATDLAGLEVGNCFLWSPQWLRTLKKIRFRKRKTFDTSKTPIAGETNIKSRTLAPIDLEKIKSDIESIVIQTKENNPVELKKQIAELHRQLNVQKVNQKTPVNPIDDKKFENLKAELAEYKSKYELCFNRINDIDKKLAGFSKHLSHAKNTLHESGLLFEKAQSLVPDLIGDISGLTVMPASISGKNILPNPHPFFGAHIHHENSQIKATGKNMHVAKSSFNNVPFIKLGKCERAILTALAQRIGTKSSKSYIGVKSGYSSRSGSFSNALSNLRKGNLIIGNGDDIEITRDGWQTLGDYEPLPIGEALHQYWFSELHKAESMILKVLVDGHPQAFSKEELGKATGYAHTSGSFSNALSKLRTLELIEGGGGNISASKSLFEN